jgi:hypothetical protein
MAYYTALINAWNGGTQPPTGVVGTALNGGMTTAQKIAAVNGWTVTVTIPASYTITANQIASCIKWSEYAALSASQQLDVRALLAIQGPISVGSSAGELALFADGMIVAYFPSGGATITNLSAFAPGALPFWQATVAQGGAGLNGPVSLSDTQAAGLT